MNKAVKASKEVETTPAKAPAKTAAETKENPFPIFVEAEKMFEHFAEITRETAHKAFEFFLRRGGDFGQEIDDWFRAEAELLRPVTVEITETDKLINVSAMIPGFKPEEIAISIDGNLLIMSGKTEAKDKKEDENTVYSEWHSNRFFRQLRLPSEVDADKVKATLDHGVLTLKMPKAAPHEVKKIAVSAG